MNENQNANMSRKEYNKLQSKQTGNSSSVFDGKEFLLRLADVELPSGSTTIWDLPEGYIFKDENGNVINATKIVLEKKKNEYPKTYEECCEILEDVADCSLSCFACGVLNNLQKLLLCRAAYWKLYGEEMGLGKPWEPDWEDDTTKYTLVCINNGIEKDWELHVNHILAFPTKEMRDAFYENFKELINKCKELL